MSTSEDGGAESAREAAHLRIAERLLEELGPKADDHCLTMTYYLLRAGRLADRSLLLRFASRAARIALEHDSCYVAGRYFQAAARAGAGVLSLEERATLFYKAGEAYRRWSDPGLSIECFRDAARLYGQSGNPTSRAVALKALRDGLSGDAGTGGTTFSVIQSKCFLIRAALTRAS